MKLKTKHVGQELGIDIMPQHEIKSCPRCGRTFECKPGPILLCQCSKIELTQQERALIQTQFQDCLCLQCLKVLKEQFQIEQRKTT
ncbi:MAG: hypothetical protein DRR19_17725 [Candidatus Parabeggiatoa sp. nov. 1]|nr:MAG: hypothetical protein DRR19_17725 [Gammaproteobacteria bacterium]HEC85219.1 hypothetical protein [Thioploca sp.]